MQLIRHRLETASSRQKSYVDTRRQPLEFQKGDHVFLNVLPKRGIMRFGKKGKLSPFIGLFQILKRVREVAYKLALPPHLSIVHHVFHVLMLRKYLHNPSCIIAYDDCHVEKVVTYVIRHIQILDWKDHTIRNCSICLVKVL